MIELASPGWLLWLPLPVVIWWLWRRRDRDATIAVIHPMTRLITRLQDGHGPGDGIPWRWLLGCTLLIVAMARPQWIDSAPEHGAPGHNLIFAVDVSGSMRTLDYHDNGTPISRLDMLKRSLIQFLERANRIRAGIVIFADDAMTFMPLTSDLAVAAQMVDEIDNSLGGERTALGDAIVISIRRMQAVLEPDTARILVLLTDGVSTAGVIPPEAAAALARSAGIRLYTVGIGSGEPGRFPLSQTEDPMIVDMPLDEDRLKSLAEGGGGEYFRIDKAGDVARVLAHIERVEKGRIPVPRGIHDWTWMPAAGGLILLMLAERRGRYRGGYA